jgi:cytoskeletal protein RodZ
MEVMSAVADQLRALEEGNFDVFSAPVYIRGFVRSYATLLHLDVPQVMAALEAELAATTKFAEPPPLTEHPYSLIDFLTLHLSKVDWRKGLIGLGAVIALAALVSVWVALHHRNPLKGLKPAVYQSTPGTSGDTLPLPAPAPKR